LQRSDHRGLKLANRLQNSEVGRPRCFAAQIPPVALILSQQLHAGFAIWPGAIGFRGDCTIVG
jgi:hypothetical protein